MARVTGKGSWVRQIWYVRAVKSGCEAFTFPKGKEIAGGGNISTNEEQASEAHALQLEYMDTSTSHRPLAPRLKCWAVVRVLVVSRTIQLVSFVDCQVLEMINRSSIYLPERTRYPPLPTNVVWSLGSLDGWKVSSVG